MNEDDEVYWAGELSGAFGDDPKPEKPDKRFTMLAIAAAVVMLAVAAVAILARR